MSDANSQPNSNGDSNQGAGNNQPNGGVQNPNPQTPPETPKTPDPVPYERFEQVNKRKNELEEAFKAREKADKEAEEKRLAEQGEFKTLAEKEKARAEEALKNFNDFKKQVSVEKVLREKGAVDSNVVVKLLDLNLIEVSEDGTVKEESITKQVDALKTSSPYLFGLTQKPNVGANQGGNPQGGGQGVVYKRSQLTNSKFYNEHRDDILLAQKEGRIIDDN